MPGKTKKPVSKAQARLFGAVAGGAVKLSGMTAKDAKSKLKGVHEKKLPEYKKKKK